MVKAYYKNSKGEVLWLTRAPFRTIDADWFDSTWKESDSGYEKTVTLDVFGKREEFIQNMETLYKMIHFFRVRFIQPRKQDGKGMCIPK
jgi:hypothetical protein